MRAGLAAFLALALFGAPLTASAYSTKLHMVTGHHIVQKLRANNCRITVGGWNRVHTVRDAQGRQTSVDLSANPALYPLPPGADTLEVDLGAGVGRVVNICDLLTNPETSQYFVSATTGPDTFPGMFGNTDPTHAFLWNTSWQIPVLWQNAARIGNDLERRRAQAFVLGWVVHFAGDLNAHGLANLHANGVWMARSDVGTVWKHILAESYYASAMVPYPRAPQFDNRLVWPEAFVKKMFFNPESPLYRHLDYLWLRYVDGDGEIGMVAKLFGGLYRAGFLGWDFFARNYQIWAGREEYFTDNGRKDSDPLSWLTWLVANQARLFYEEKTRLSERFIEVWYKATHRAQQAVVTDWTATWNGRETYGSDVDSKGRLLPVRRSGGVGGIEDAYKLLVDAAKELLAPDFVTIPELDRYLNLIPLLADVVRGTLRALKEAILKPIKDFVHSLLDPLLAQIKDLMQEEAAQRLMPNMVASIRAQTAAFGIEPGNIETYLNWPIYRNTITAGALMLKAMQQLNPGTDRDETTSPTFGLPSGDFGCTLECTGMFSGFSRLFMPSAGTYYRNAAIQRAMPDYCMRSGFNNRRRNAAELERSGASRTSNETFAAMNNHEANSTADGGVAFTCLAKSSAKSPACGSDNYSVPAPRKPFYGNPAKPPSGLPKFLGDFFELIGGRWSHATSKVDSDRGVAVMPPDGVLMPSSPSQRPTPVVYLSGGSVQGQTRAPPAPVCYNALKINARTIAPSLPSPVSDHLPERQAARRDGFKLTDFVPEGVLTAAILVGGALAAPVIGTAFVSFFIDPITTALIGFAVWLTGQALDWLAGALDCAGHALHTDCSAHATELATRTYNEKLGLNVRGRFDEFWSKILPSPDFITSDYGWGSTIAPAFHGFVRTFFEEVVLPVAFEGDNQIGCWYWSRKTRQGGERLFLQTIRAKWQEDVAREEGRLTSKRDEMVGRREDRVRRALQSVLDAMRSGNKVMLDFSAQLVADTLRRIVQYGTLEPAWVRAAFDVFGNAYAQRVGACFSGYRNAADAAGCLNGPANDLFFARVRDLANGIANSISGSAREMAVRTAETLVQTLRRAGVTLRDEVVNALRPGIMNPRLTATEVRRCLSEAGQAFEPHKMSQLVTCIAGTEAAFVPLPPVVNFVPPLVNGIQKRACEVGDPEFTRAFLITSQSTARHSRGPVAIRGADAAAFRFVTAPPSARQIESGGSEEFRIAARCLREGHLEASLVFSDERRDYSVPLRVPCGMPPGADPIVSPSTVTLGIVGAVGATKRATVTLTNRGPGVLKRQTVVIVGPQRRDFTLLDGAGRQAPAVKSAIAANGGRETFTVAFRCSSAGSKKAALVVDTIDRRGELVRDQLGLTGKQFTTGAMVPASVSALRLRSSRGMVTATVAPSKFSRPVIWEGWDQRLSKERLAMKTFHVNLFAFCSGPPEALVNPVALPFGTRKIGPTPTERAFSLFNVGTVTLQRLRAWISGPNARSFGLFLLPYKSPAGMTMSPSGWRQIGPGANEQFLVRFTCGDAGQKFATVNVQTATGTKTIPLSGTCER